MTEPLPFPAFRTLTDVLDEELQALQSAGLRRMLRPVQQRQAGTVLFNGERVADFASNDYLGLASDPRIARAATAVLQAEGTGAGAARLISGNHPVHESLERELARFKGCEHALLYPTGYMVNIGVIPALVGANDVIYSDELNHASLIDGCRLSKATLRVFPHCDVTALTAQLEADRGRFGRALIVVEGVFSMDGDLFPLDALVDIAGRFGAWTYVDDAHGTGVLGATGAGAIEHFGVTGRIDVVVGTLGKALGTTGAWVAGSQTLIEFLTSRSRSFIFTTGSPPAMAAAALGSCPYLSGGVVASRGRAGTRPSFARPVAHTPDAISAAPKMVISSRLRSATRCAPWLRLPNCVAADFS